MQKKNIDIFFTTLQKLYPENRTDLIWKTPWQLLVAVVMSAQTTDKQVNNVTKHFFDNIQTPYDTLQLSLEQRSQLIKGVNYAPTKARNLYTTAQMLTEGRTHPNYHIPDTLSDLIKLSGVGEKTAKVILHVLYNTNDIAVDTHVHRVMNRIGLVNTASPIQTSKIIDNAIPKRYAYIAHHTLIFFGRYHCLARKPKCESCPFTSFCRYYKNNINS
ncbi:Endonuclease III [candidate division SR1 bacterium Aalborg_AAW-1]|nr:Endonuclease III [candidate division SR1 bacterium Aalborg_AAW-1]